ncbi:MAG TPA: helix-turn-helix domain-containing protein [Gaiellaceae bacterium]|jgi:excisionase family DNA binding protein
MPHRDHLAPTPEAPRNAPLALSVVLPPEQFEALAVRVAELINDGRDDGFLDVPGAAEYLCSTPKAVYHLVERRRLPHRRAGGRLLFDRAELRAWVERG